VRLRPIIRFGKDPDGVVRWSTMIVDDVTGIPICHLISAATQHEAESNAQQVYQLFDAMMLLNLQLSQTLDLSLWPVPLRKQFRPMPPRP
jgi:hypothetical protein